MVKSLAKTYENEARITTKNTGKIIIRVTAYMVFYFLLCIVAQQLIIGHLLNNVYLQKRKTTQTNTLPSLAGIFT